VTGLNKNPDGGERVTIFQGSLTKGGKDRLCIIRTRHFGTSGAASNTEIELCERAGLNKVSQGEIKLGGREATVAVMEKSGDRPYLQGMYWTKAGSGELGWYIFWEAFGSTRNEAAAMLTKAAESVEFFNSKDGAARRPGYFVSSRFGVEINIEQFKGTVRGVVQTVVMSWSVFSPGSRESLGTFYVQVYAADGDRQSFLNDFESHRADMLNSGTVVKEFMGTSFQQKHAVFSTLDKKGASTRWLWNELRIWDGEIIWIVTECHQKEISSENAAKLKAAFDSFKIAP